MTFFEAFDKVKASMKGAKADKKIGHVAIQVNLNDPDASGICYIEVNNGKVFVEPYDYYDRDAIIHISHSNLVDIMKGKLTFEKAVTENILTIEGDYNKAILLKNLVKKPAAKKTATKKAPAKKETVKKETAVKAETKKTEEKKVEETKATAPKAETKKTAAKKTTEAKKTVAKTETKKPAAANADIKKATTTKKTAAKK